MGKNEDTSASIASIAAKGPHDPSSLTYEEIQSICASALTQKPDYKGWQNLTDLLDKNKEQGSRGPANETI